MNDTAQLNVLAWELATLAMLKENNDLKPYSTDQIRKIMAAAVSVDSMTQLQKLRSDYKPAPPQGKRPEQSSRDISNKREKNSAFVQRFIENLKDNDRQFVQQLSQYTLWNIKILETKGIEHNISELTARLELLLECEGIDKKMVVDKIKVMVESGQGTRKSYAGDSRRSTNNHRRF
jgi:hypothetical protein